MSQMTMMTFDRINATDVKVQSTMNHLTFNTTTSPWQHLLAFSRAKVRCYQLNMTKITVEVRLGSDLLKRSRVLSLGNNRVMKESVQTSDPLWVTLAAFVYSIFLNKIFSC